MITPKYKAIEDRLVLFHSKNMKLLIGSKNIACPLNRFLDVCAYDVKA